MAQSVEATALMRQWLKSTGERLEMIQEWIGGWEMGEGLTIKLPCGCVAKDASLLCPLHGQQKIDGIGPLEMRVENTPGNPDAGSGWSLPGLGVNPHPDAMPFVIRVATPAELQDAAGTGKSMNIGHVEDSRQIVFRKSESVVIDIEPMHYRASEKLSELGYRWDGKEWVKG